MLILAFLFMTMTKDYNNNDYGDDDKTLPGASVPFEQRAEAAWTKRRGGRGAREAAVG